MAHFAPNTCLTHSNPRLAFETDATLIDWRLLKPNVAV